MAFTNVPWANGDTITEVKLDEMVANDVHVRGEVNYYPIGILQLYGIIDTGGGAPSITVHMKIDTSTTIATFTGSGSFVQADIDISAYSAGLHSITIDPTSASLHDQTSYFYKSPDMQYLTIKAEIGSQYYTGTDYLTFVTATLIGHRETKSWT